MTSAAKSLCSQVLQFVMACTVKGACRLAQWAMCETTGRMQQRAFLATGMNSKKRCCRQVGVNVDEFFVLSGVSSLETFLTCNHVMSVAWDEHYVTRKRLTSQFPAMQH